MKRLRSSSGGAGAMPSPRPPSPVLVPAPAAARGQRRTRIAVLATLAALSVASLGLLAGAALWHRELARALGVPTRMLGGGITFTDEFPYAAWMGGDDDGEGDGVVSSGASETTTSSNGVEISAPSSLPDPDTGAVVGEEAGARRPRGGGRQPRRNRPPRSSSTTSQREGDDALAAGLVVPDLADDETNATATTDPVDISRPSGLKLMVDKEGWEPLLPEDAIGDVEPGTSSSAASTADTRATLALLRSTALRPHAVIPPSSNPVARAYALLLAAQLSLPASQRTYLVARPESGWGNKVRALVAALRLALATGRILLLDDAFISPIFPSVFVPAFDPLLTSGVRDGATRARLAAAATHPGSYLFLRNKLVSPLAACWRAGSASHNLTACLLAFGALPPVIVLETNQPVYLLIAKSVDLQGVVGHALQTELEAPYNGAGMGAALAADDTVFNRYAYAALLATPVRKLAGAVAAQKAKMKWDAARVRVGVHIRLFVDSRRWSVPSHAVGKGWWDCVRGAVWAAHATRDAAAGVLTPTVPSPNNTLIFLATDRPAMRPSFAAHLRDVGRVAWFAPAAAFVNSRDSKGVGALRTILTDWMLLSDADVIVGTEKSSFTTAGAMRSGAWQVVGALRGGRCSRPAGGPPAGAGRGEGRGARRGASALPPPSSSLPSSTDAAAAAAADASLTAATAGAVVGGTDELEIPRRGGRRARRGSRANV